MDLLTAQLARLLEAANEAEFAASYELAHAQGNASPEYVAHLEVLHGRVLDIRTAAIEMASSDGRERLEEETRVQERARTGGKGRRRSPWVTY